MIPTLAGHLIAGGGKRMRPMLTLAGAALCDYQGNRHYKLAAAVEFIHTATLLHDDVVDGSDLRRVTGYQDFVDEAPLDLVYVADHRRMRMVPVAQREIRVEMAPASPAAPRD